MEKFYDKISNVLIPISSKFDNQKHIQAIKEGMIAVVPIIILGSFCLVPLALSHLFTNGILHNLLANIGKITSYPVIFTTGLLSIYTSFFITLSLCKKYNIEREATSVNAVLVHIILSGSLIDGNLSIKYLGAEGLFLSILSSILTVEVTRMLYKKELFIKLPETVPPMVVKSFKSLVPLITTTALSMIILTAVENLTGLGVNPTIMKLLAPVVKSMDSLPAMIIIILLTQLLWFFGIHGAAVTSAIWVPFAVMYGGENIAAHAAGLPTKHLFTFGFYYAMIQVTGSGITLGLVLMMMKSKSKNLSSIAKASLAPSLFGINEPIIFGAPIILNPFMFIPFVFGPVLITIITYITMTSGLVGMPIAEPPSFLPPGVGAFLMTYDLKAVALVIFNIIFMTILYYPFFKVMEKLELQKEII